MRAGRGDAPAPPDLARFTASSKVAWSEGERRPTRKRRCVRVKPTARRSMLDAVRGRRLAWLEGAVGVVGGGRVGTSARPASRPVQRRSPADGAAVHEGAAGGDGARGAAWAGVANLCDQIKGGDAGRH